MSSTRPVGYAERLIGSIRRECLDHIIIGNERGLRRVLRAYVQYYNDVRPHSSLGYLTPAAFKAKHLEDVDRGRSPALPARADLTKNEEQLTGPSDAILQ